MPYVEGMKITKPTRQIVAAAFPEYTGRKISQDFSGTVRFEDLNWSGGTRSEFRAVRLSDGASQPLPVAAPWANPIEGAEIAIPAGFAIVRFSTYCGGIPFVRVFYGVVPDPKRITSENICPDGCGPCAHGEVSCLCFEDHAEPLLIEGAAS